MPWTLWSITKLSYDSGRARRLRFPEPRRVAQLLGGLIELLQLHCMPKSLATCGSCVIHLEGPVDQTTLAHFSKLVPLRPDSIEGRHRIRHVVPEDQVYERVAQSHVVIKQSILNVRMFGLDRAPNITGEPLALEVMAYAYHPRPRRAQEAPASATLVKREFPSELGHVADHVSIISSECRYGTRSSKDSSSQLLTFRLAERFARC